VIPSANEPRDAIEELKELRARLRPKILAWAFLAAVAGNLVVFGFLLIFSELPNRQQICPVMVLAGVMLLVLTIRAIRFHNVRLAKRARELGYEIKRSQSGQHFVQLGTGPEKQGKAEIRKARDVGRFCRACCLRLDADESAAVCAACKQVFHTACMQQQGLCLFCAENSEIPEDVDEYCQIQEWETLIELDSPAFTKAEPDSVVPLEGQNLFGRFLEMKTGRGYVPEMPPQHYAQHGWPLEDMQKRKASCCIIYYLWIPFMLSIYFNWDGLGGILILFATSYVAYLLLAAIGDWIRGKMWPLKEPSPAKRRLIAWRTWLFGTAWALYLIMLVGMAFESQLDPWFYQQVTALGLLCGIAAVASLALGAVSLVVE
jgi:hypothetical protein